jgi:predicted 3-demethylubiquinone-9 3-methyltransferase (glyoxalase superfamily)
MALNAGSEFKFNEAVSFVIVCVDQDEINYYWERLSSVPEAEQCGWCKDRFGLSWQVVPENVGELLKRPGAYANMMRMKKLIIDQF